MILRKLYPVFPPARRLHGKKRKSQNNSDFLWIVIFILLYLRKKHFWFVMEEIIDQALGIIAQIVGYGFVIFTLFVCWVMLVEAKEHGDDPIFETTITFFPDEDKDTDGDLNKQTKPRHRPDDSGLLESPESVLDTKLQCRPSLLCVNDKQTQTHKLYDDITRNQCQRIYLSPLPCALTADNHFTFSYLYNNNIPISRCWRKGLRLLVPTVPGTMSISSSNSSRGDNLSSCE